MGRAGLLVWLVEGLAASVLGLLEVREMKVREEIAGLRKDAEPVQPALGGAGYVMRRLVDAHVTVAEVLAESPSRTGSTA